jgi:hypothetical protein
LNSSASLRHLSSDNNANNLRNQEVAYQRVAIDPNQQYYLTPYQQNVGPIDRNRAVSYRK